jgi:signal peptidase II
MPRAPGADAVVNERQSRLLYLAVGVLAAAADLISKWWVFASFELQARHPLLDGVLYLFPTRNPAGPWSLGRGVPALLRFALPALSVVAVGIIARFLWTTDPRDRVRCLGLALILGGAAGNLWDRGATALDGDYGGVRDFILVPRVWFEPGFPRHIALGGDFPAFNLADACITAGVCLVAWRILREWHPPGETFAADGSPAA